ncbi:MAG: hypothetical protein V3W41_22865 [Planctomycetota bacterium]
MTMPQLHRSTALAFVLGFVFLTSPAWAQTGVDLIIGDIPNIANYNPSNGIDAFSLSITTCNIGTAAADWNGASAAHPAFVQSLYRFANGQFEMIGRSSARHAFIAVAQSACGSCTGSGGITLSAGCSDAMSASVVGSQNGTGLIDEVDGFSGNVVFPPSDINTLGDSAFKRLQVATAEFDSLVYPNAKYFVQCQVISADDAAAGNGTNNMSWREITISGGPNNYNASFPAGSSIHREESVLQAWRSEDMSARVVPALFPTEGRFLVGYRGTAVGAGQWRYEFAVQNLNSDLSAGGFRIDFLPGANISDIEFHDLGYHSGEPYAETDWTTTIASDHIEWSSVDFATDANANGLRFGSIYNFRFTSDMPPTDLPIDGRIISFKPTVTPVHHFVVPPSSTLTKVSGEGARANIEQDFDRELVVNLSTDSGTPLANVAITFQQISGPAVTIGGTGIALTDANGNASINLAASINFGSVVIEATFDDQVLTFSDLFVRRLSRVFTGVSGVLILFVNIDWDNVPITLAVDDPGVAATTTPFGIISTSLLNPGPSFYGESGFPDSGLAFRPNLVTSSLGALTRVYSGLGFLHGSGITLNHQAYSLRFVNGELEVYISNTITETY